MKNKGKSPLWPLEQGFGKRAEASLKRNGLVELNCAKRNRPEALKGPRGRAWTHAPALWAWMPIRPAQRSTEEKARPCSVWSASVQRKSPFANSCLPAGRPTVSSVGKGQLGLYSNPGGGITSVV